MDGYPGLATVAALERLISNESDRSSVVKYGSVQPRQLSQVFDLHK